MNAPRIAEPGMGLNEALYRRKAGFIDYSRGRLAILDRKGLEEGACECYEIVRRETKRLLKA